MNIFVFDIETVPDVENGRRWLSLTGASDEDVAQAMRSLAKESNGSEFLKHPWHKVIAISAVFRKGDTLKIWSLGEESATEPEIIQRFFAGIEKYTPTLVSWNGSAFDLPVLHYRTLLHGIVANRYWESGEHDNTFKFNNYINRYHARHLDLMDILSAYQQKAFAKLDEIATLLGFPGKMGMSGEEVYANYLNGKLKEIRQYCEIDVLNTYLIFLRFQLMRGYLTNEQYELEIILAKNVLEQSAEAHLLKFLQAWEK